mmetsp:Transcript_78315/g.221474  ORF Transcript_78315/g.221474 Transcript_78315/m.221474 type:complete len:355 (+) Transcript_78315:395-1459(+)
MDGAVVQLVRVTGVHRGPHQGSSLAGLDRDAKLREVRLAARVGVREVHEQAVQPRAPGRVPRRVLVMVLFVCLPLLVLQDLHVLSVRLWHLDELRESLPHPLHGLAEVALVAVAPGLAAGPCFTHLVGCKAALEVLPRLLQQLVGLAGRHEAVQLQEPGVAAQHERLERLVRNHGLKDAVQIAWHQGRPRVGAARAPVPEVDVADAAGEAALRQHEGVVAPALALPGPVWAVRLQVAAAGRLALATTGAAAVAHVARVVLALAPVRPVVARGVVVNACLKLRGGDDGPCGRGAALGPVRVGVVRGPRLALDQQIRQATAAAALLVALIIVDRAPLALRALARELGRRAGPREQQ